MRGMNQGTSCKSRASFECAKWNIILTPTRDKQCREDVPVIMGAPGLIFCAFCEVRNWLFCGSCVLVCGDISEQEHWNWPVVFMHMREIIGFRRVESSKASFAVVGFRSASNPCYGCLPMPRTWQPCSRSRRGGCYSHGLRRAPGPEGADAELGLQPNWPGSPVEAFGSLQRGWLLVGLKWELWKGSRRFRLPSGEIGDICLKC